MAPTEPDPASAAPFPRERLTELLGDAEAARRRRERLQGWLVGIGLAIGVLGLPSERLWGDMALVRMTAGNGQASTGIVFPLASLLTRGLGLGPEQACFLLSALAYGLLVPAGLRLMRVIGFDHGPSMVGVCVAVLAPVAWLGAAQPSDYAPGVLGATLLLTTLFQPRQRLRFGYQWRAAAFFFLAVLLRPENILLLPAVVWAVVVSSAKRREGGALAGMSVALVTLTGLRVLLAGHGDTFWAAVLAGGRPDWSSAPVWIGTLTLGMGSAGLGLYSLLFDRRQAEETPPPTWMVPWCLVALVPLLGGSPSAGPVAGFLVPAAAVGLADWLTRREHVDVARRWMIALVVVQLVAAGGLRVGWDLGDPLGSKGVEARAVLNPDDVVLCADPDLAYLAGLRWGLEVYPDSNSLPPSVAADIESGARRLVLLQPPEQGRPAHPDLPAGVLYDGALVQLGPGEPWSR
jgi:hypothetical protein